MRILFFTPCYKPYLGGVERVIEQICLYMLQNPDIEKIGILTSYYRFPGSRMKELPSEEIIDGAHVFRRQYLPKNVPFFYHIGTGAFTANLRSVIKKFNPTHVHYFLCDWWLPNMQMLLSSRKAAQIYTVFDHNFPVTLRTLPFLYANRFMAKRCDAVHVVSQRAKAKVATLFHAPEKRVHVIPLGKPVDGISPKGGSTEPITIISVGRLSLRKGQFDLVKCFLNIRASTSIACRLVLVGGDGGDEERIRDSVMQSSFQNDILILGHISQEELDSWYARSDIFALLTTDESFGLVFTEAMNAGLPVVTYNVGPLEELFPCGVKLIPYGDLQQVQSVLNELIHDDKKRNDLAFGAQNFIREHPDWKHVANSIVRLYKTLEHEGR